MDDDDGPDSSMHLQERIKIAEKEENERERERENVI
jgi:hypothetical protein